MLLPVPQCDHLVGVGTVLVFSTKESSQPKVGQLDLSAVVHQNVGALDVTVEKVVAVTVAESVEQLSHDVPNVALGEGHQARLEQAH